MNKDPRRNQLKRRLAPGFWEDQAGHLHISIPELLDHFDLPDTPENQAEVRRMMENLLHQHCPTTQIIHREQPEQ